MALRPCPWSEGSGTLGALRWGAAHSPHACVVGVPRGLSRGVLLSVPELREDMLAFLAAHPCGGGVGGEKSSARQLMAGGSGWSEVPSGRWSSPEGWLAPGRCSLWVARVGGCRESADTREGGFRSLLGAQGPRLWAPRPGAALQPHVVLALQGRAGHSAGLTGLGKYQWAPLGGGCV